MKKIISGKLNNISYTVEQEVDANGNIVGVDLENEVKQAIMIEASKPPMSMNEVEKAIEELKKEARDKGLPEPEFNLPRFDIK